jgi:hypothetical protein
LIRALVVAGFAAASVLLGAGCFIFTGSTDGYDLAATDSGSADGAAACDPDATCISLTCLGTSDCDGGACCLVEVGGGIGSACQTSCVGPQFCKGNGDCTGESCTSQSCTSNGVSVVVNACGSVPACTP